MLQVLAQQAPRLLGFRHSRSLGSLDSRRFVAAGVLQAAKTVEKMVIRVTKSITDFLDISFFSYSCILVDLR